MCTGVLALWLFAPVLLTAQDRDTMRYFDIPTQPLAAALLEFSEQAGLQILVSSELTESRLSAPVSGRYTAVAALSQLLAPHSLRFRYVASKTIAIADEARDPGAGESSQAPPGQPR